MIKNPLSVLALAIAAVLVFCPAYSQEDMEKVDASVFENPQRVPATFMHDEHNENAGIDECSECHHIYEDGVKLEDESSEDESCSGCHELKDSDGQPGLRKAFHMNCKGCHLEAESGPITCGACHKK